MLFQISNLVLSLLLLKKSVLLTILAHENLNVTAIIIV